MLPATALVVAGFVVAGCGGDKDESTKPPATPVAAATFNVESALAGSVPENAAAFAELNIRPSGDAKAAFEEIGRIFGEDDLGKSLLDELDLDDGLKGGKTFEKDVLPHLGDHLGGFALTPAAGGSSKSTKAKQADGALVAEVKDADALRATLKPALGKDTKTVTIDGQETYQSKDDVTAWIGDKTMVIGTKDAVTAAIAAEGAKTLADNARFTTAIKQVRATDPVAIGWTDVQQAPALAQALSALESESGDGKKALKKLSGSGLSDLAGGDTGELDDVLGNLTGKGAGKGSVPEVDATVAMAVVMKPGQLKIEFGGTVPKPADGKASTAGKDASDAVAALPAGSWAAFGTSLAGTQSLPGGSFEDGLKQLEELSGEKLPKALTDAFEQVKTAAIGVRGDSLLAIGGQAVIRATDAAAASKLLDTFQKELGKASGITVAEQAIPGAERGVVASSSELPVKIAAGTKGDVLVIGLGVDSVTTALEGTSKLSGDPAYKQAKDALDGDAPALLVNPTPLAQLLGDLPTEDMKEIVGAVRGIKLIASSHVDTAPTTWRGAFVLQYDAAALTAAVGDDDSAGAPKPGTVTETTPGR